MLILQTLQERKKYSSVWSKIVNMIFRLVKEGEYVNAA